MALTGGTHLGPYRISAPLGAGGMGEVYRARAIVPGHGPVLRDDSYVVLLSRLFASVKRQTEAAIAEGRTLEQTRGRIDLSEFRARFAGRSPVRQNLFDMYVRGPAVASAYRDARGDSLRQYARVVFP